MPDYKESVIDGLTWQRCSQIVVDNPRDGAPSVRFDEEEILALADGREVRRALGTLTQPFDPAQEIPLRNPATSELTGEIATYGAAYALLYSAYMAAAEARDTAQTAHIPSEPN
jgi:hypothetical protein